MIRVERTVHVCDIIEVAPEVDPEKLASLLRNNQPSSQYFEEGVMMNAFFYHAGRTSTIFIADKKRNETNLYYGMTFKDNDNVEGGSYVAKIVYGGTLGKLYFKSYLQKDLPPYAKK